jgi:superfamily II helicase
MNITYNLDKFTNEYKYSIQKKNDWKKLNILFLDDQDFLYWFNRYNNSKKCELCQIPFKSTRQRHMDHNHITRLPRNVICCKCNRNRIDNKQIKSSIQRYIYKDKKTDYYVFQKLYLNNHRFIRKRKNLNDLNWIKFSYLILNKNRFYT